MPYNCARVPRGWRRAIALAVFLSIGTICAAAGALGQQIRRSPSLEEIEDLQAKYRTERKDADRIGLASMFSQELFRRADQWAKKSEKAKAEGRLPSARDAIREARRQMPVRPTRFPDDVARVFGTLKFCHAHWIHALAFHPDG